MAWVSGSGFRIQSYDLFVGEVLGPGLEGAADAVKRIALASAVPEGVLLHAAAYLIDGLPTQLHDMEGIMPISVGLWIERCFWPDAPRVSVAGRRRDEDT